MIPGNPDTYYDKPIAVLTGPSAGSAGDWSSLEMRLHPMVRTFGKPSNGAFSTLDKPDLGYANWFFSYATGSGILLFDPNSYLIHTGAPVDDKVWFTKDDVAKGRDTVVETAISWINKTLSIEEKGYDSDLSELYIMQNYPNPFNASTTIRYRIEYDSRVTVQIYDLVGRLITTLQNSNQTQGWHLVVWNGTNQSGEQLPAGMYFCRIRSDYEVKTSKLMLLK
jgi:hypothetical protein